MENTQINNLMNKDTHHNNSNSSTSVSTGSYYNHGCQEINSTADSAVPINRFHSNWSKTRKRTSDSSSCSYNRKIFDSVFDGIDEETTISAILQQILICKKNKRSEENCFKKRKTVFKSKKVSELVDIKKSSLGCYECKICKEVFNDFHGLGGHIASHNRKKRAEEEEEVPLEKVSNHVCQVCSKSFLTGQALGGHKASHKKAARVKVASSDQNPGFQFDLNDSTSESFWGGTGTGLVY